MRREKKPALKIVGRLTGIFSELHADGCIQTGADVHPELAEAESAFRERFYLLMGLTAFNPCDGCPSAGAFSRDPVTRVDQIKCKAFQKYHTMAQKDRQQRDNRLHAAIDPPGTNQYPGLSVAQIAERLGISKSEVRRRKKDGLI